ncbi:MAG: MarR family winged helix-turn-helix transcriptional regulator [Collinsella sp.]|nr:MarR family winged helix-turn-helix transcriptional regulator [Collinsella sp.]
MCDDERFDDELARRLLLGLGFCGHYMHFHRGGRSGRAPILCWLAQHGGQVSQVELGGRFEIKPGSLSEILAKIETAGFIERTRNPNDRRQLTIALTEKGRAEAEREEALRARFRRRAFVCLSPEEQLQLAEMLDRIRETWEELDD